MIYSIYKEVSVRERVQIMAGYTQNTLVLGEAGSGKSYRIAREAVIDAARGGKDIFLMTNSLSYLNVLEKLTRNGYDVRVFSVAYRPSAPHLSCRYNPLSYIEGIEDIILIASTLASVSFDEGELFHYQAVREYLAACIALLMHEGTDLSLPGLYRFITRSHGTLENIFDELSSQEPSSFLKFARDQYSAFKSFTNPYLSEQVVILCLSALAPFVSDSISGKIDGDDQMALAALGCPDRKLAIVFEVCSTDLRLNSLGKLLVFQAYRCLCSFPQKPCGDVLFILDGLGAFSHCYYLPYYFALRNGGRVTTLATITSSQLFPETRVFETLFGSAAGEVRSCFTDRITLHRGGTPIIPKVVHREEINIGNANRKGKPVRCVDTGEIFPTVRSAARWFIASHDDVSLKEQTIAIYIGQCAKGDRTSVRGTHWEFADQASEKTLPEGN